MMTSVRWFALTSGRSPTSARREVKKRTRISRSMCLMELSEDGGPVSADAIATSATYRVKTISNHLASYPERA